MARALIDDREPTAFVDESLRPGPNGFYVVAAVVLLDDIPRARISAEKVPPGGKRFHWKDEREASRLAMLDVLLELGVGLWSYECRRCPTSKQERARTKCFELLLWDLKELGVEQLVIEARGRAADRKDARAIGHAQRASAASTRLVYEHRQPNRDSSLWLPDALAGAVASAIAGHPSYRDRLGQAVTRKVISI